MINFKLLPENFNYLGTEYRILTIKLITYKYAESRILETIENFNNEIEWGDMFNFDTVVDRLKNGMKMYILVGDNDNTTYGHVWFKDHKDGRNLFNLYVRNDIANKTYTGKEFVSDIIHRYESNTPIYCEVDDWNVKSINLFKRLGFLEYEILDTRNN